MKLVKESISFERYKDPKKALGLDIRELIEEWLKKNNFNSSGLQQNRINYAKQSYIINPDLTIDILFGWSVYLYEAIDELPEYIQFGEILGGSFTLENLGLTSMRGFPKKVNGDFSVRDNKLTSLEYCPEFVFGEFNCGDNTTQFTLDDVKNHCRVRGVIHTK